MTYIIRVDRAFNGIGFIWSFLRGTFSPKLTENIKGMKKLKGNLGAIFDVDEADKAEIEEY